MVADTTLYDLLGVDPSIDDRGLKKAYAKKALECHPDKHPDDPDATEKFQRLNEAWEVLRDPEKRRIYDEHGADGLREHHGGGAFDDILSHLFGFPARGGVARPPRPRTRDIIHELPVSLAELFNGAEKTITATRHVPCEVCQGTGCLSGVKPEMCEKCSGQGRVIGVSGTRRALIVCPDCEGAGQVIPPQGRCNGCAGDCFVAEDRDQLVHVERGMEDDDHIVFQGAADEVPGADTGDLIVVIREQPDANFERKHNDLLYRKKLSLSEALFGARFVVHHLDGRKVVITTSPKEVITPGTVHMVPGEGMPSRSDPFQRGRLFILYSVAFPEHKTLTKEFRRQMCRVVPHLDGAKGVDLKAQDVVCVTAKQAEVGAFEAAQDVADDRHEEEEEEAGGAPGVECTPM